MPPKTTLAKKEVIKKRIRAEILVDLDYIQEFSNYIKEFDSKAKKLIILEAADGLGKSTLLKNLDSFNKSLRSKYYDLNNYKKFLSDSPISFEDICCIHLCDQYPLAEIEQKMFILSLKEKLKYCSVILSTTDYAKIKNIIPNDLWSNSLLMKLLSPSPVDLEKYISYRSKQLVVNIDLKELQEKIERQRTFSQVNHVLINYKEFGREAVIFKENVNLTQSHSEIAQEKISETLSNLCKTYEISKPELFSRSRKKELVAIKQRVYFELKVTYHFTYSQIAKFFNIDHTTVMYSVNKIYKNKVSLTKHNKRN